ncbi:Methyltransferase domain-containing protein [Flavobacterium micromati]|uniref:Methyltransferase domain-containing protein n=1 Tax=Flavobacterium micromati TaxID=229205 RepID=A0A1M5J367_9FLAO|nr:methyltransferase domain-containing protein [Flavobacterium micromati]MCL6461260.1 methyltransferase domain-containing protein [Flavobacterium micromati]SHG35036.1 Methyltransferase domain-containing protein [Flavobacterium micromati]
MALNTDYRTDKPEIMDDFEMEGELLRNALDKIAKINQLLGGNKLTLQGVQYLLKSFSKTDEIVIVDVGCGNGDMLRNLADFALENKLNFRLIGIDANNFTVSHAKNLSSNYSNISYNCQDIFSESFRELNYDIVLCTLTLHHFKEEEINELLQIFYSNAAIGIVINDLQRSALAYRLFQGLCFVFQLNEMSREDGLTSILRGFKRNELESFSKKLKFNNYKIHWKWAFRYQWIISKI